MLRTKGTTEIEATLRSESSSSHSPPSITTNNITTIVGTFVLPPMDGATLLQHAKMQKWFRKGKPNILADVPYPTDDNDNELPHGAHLDFDTIPPHLHSRRALIWWLRLRKVNVPGNYPMMSFTSECGSQEPGLIQLVDRYRKKNAPCMTLEQVI